MALSKRTKNKTHKIPYKLIVVEACLIVLFESLILYSRSVPRPSARADLIEVHNVKGAENSRSQVYANDSDIYINLDGDGIYRYISDDNLELVKDLKNTFVFTMVCTNRYIIYTNRQFDTYRLDLKTKEEIRLFRSDEEPQNLFAYKDDYFVLLSDGSLWLFEGDDLEGQNITEYMQENCNLTEEYSDLTCTYGAYTLYGGSKDNKINIYLLEREDWQAPVGYFEACKLEDGLVTFINWGDEAYDSSGKILLYEYHDYKSKVYCYQYQGTAYEVLAGIDSTDGVVSSLSYNKEDKVYTIIRYGMKRDGREWLPTKEALFMISPTDHTEKKIFNITGGNTRIVGMDIENNQVYTYRLDEEKKKGKVYRVDLKTGKKTLLMDKINNSNNLHFCWAGDRLFIIGDRYGNYSFLGTVK